jgi:hypothetical protein
MTREKAAFCGMCVLCDGVLAIGRFPTIGLLRAEKPCPAGLLGAANNALLDLRRNLTKPLFRAL